MSAGCLQYACAASGMGTTPVKRYILIGLHHSLPLLHRLKLLRHVVQGIGAEILEGARHASLRPRYGGDL